MNVYEGLESIPAPFARSTVAIGTFDGVHVGHQAIIRTAVEDGRTHNRPTLVFTFDRHPQELLAPERAPGCLTTPEQRNRLIEALEADGLVVARFDRSLSELSPDAFVERVLKGLLGAQSVVVGEGFAFGKARAGTIAFLQQAQERYGFTLHALAPISVGGDAASSTRARQALQEGDIAGAEAILGHPYLLAGVVVTGKRLGRTIGYPTANLQLLVRQVVPADGIYAVMAHFEDGRQIGGACSIGERPTVPGAGRSIETYLFDFYEDIYGCRIALRFLARLRAEARFDSLEALQEQIAADVRQARSIVEAHDRDRHG